MKIKTINGVVDIEHKYLDTHKAVQYEVWVKWSDIKTIIAGYQSRIDILQEELGNGQVGCADYGLMGDAMLEDED